MTETPNSLQFLDILRRMALESIQRYRNTYIEPVILREHPELSQLSQADIDDILSGQNHGWVDRRYGTPVFRPNWSAEIVYCKNIEAGDLSLLIG